MANEILIHLTDADGKRRIDDGGVIRGSFGIFAVPERVAHESTLKKVLRTGLRPGQTTEYVKIPEEALNLFSRARPIGPYSIWRWLGEVYYASAHSIDVSKGTHAPVPLLRDPRLVVYGPDIIVYLGLVALVFLKLWAT